MGDILNSFTKTTSCITGGAAAGATIGTVIAGPAGTVVGSAAGVIVGTVARVLDSFNDRPKTDNCDITIEMV